MLCPKFLSELDSKHGISAFCNNLPPPPLKHTQVVNANSLLRRLFFLHKGEVVRRQKGTVPKTPI